ncbi:uncharacterized protein [Nerophis lumbriciformis]|uniref:uncharacterized protein n=1 Tax=Nerophis lumbriciformis TaxID=546530 RepID=UPI002ADF36C0|nr:uncharacterized protein LOC133621678 [Nerophis lumbriciformis]
MMKLTRLLTACILAELSLSLQALVMVNNVTAECGEQVALSCNVSRRDGLSVKHMEWSQNGKLLCRLNSKGNLSHHRNIRSDFSCKYDEGQLQLIFAKVQPQDSGVTKRYMCKLHSNMGISHGYSWIELQECCGAVKVVLSENGPVCTFSDVYPDADVFWSSHSEPPTPEKQKMFKSMEEGGWLSIRSQLEWTPNGDFNCSLRSITSGRDIACNLSENTDFLNGRERRSQGRVGNGAGSLEPFWTVVLVSTILHTRNDGFS